MAIAQANGAAVVKTLLNRSESLNMQVIRFDRGVLYALNRRSCIPFSVLFTLYVV